MLKPSNCMKCLRTQTALCLAMILMGWRGAAAETKVSIQMLGLTGELVGQAGVSHVLGGKEIEVDLIGEGPAGDETMTLKADLFQVVTGMAAPLAKDVTVAEGIEFHPPARRIVRATIPLPEVQRRTEVAVRFKVGENRVPAGQARLFVYPQDQIKELALSLERAEKDAGVSLTVFGESKRIRAFLKQSGIPFTDSGSELPSEFKTGALYLSEVDPHSLGSRRTAGARLVFFAPHPALLPGVYTTIRDAGLFTKVTLPILDTLATNPQSQRAFIDILRHSLDASAITPADSP